MTTIDLDMLQAFRARAEAEPGFAIAYAVLELARAQHVIGERLDELGLNQHGGSTAPGTTEKIAMVLEDLVGAVRALEPVV